MDQGEEMSYKTYQAGLKVKRAFKDKGAVQDSAPIDGRADYQI